MSDDIKVYQYKTLDKLVTRIRDDLNSYHFVLLFAYNGTGKTRLSMEFKQSGKLKSTKESQKSKKIVSKSKKDTLYFNAFTEDLFYWHNDLQGDCERYLMIHSQSAFFSGFQELALEDKIRDYLFRYADFDFKFDYENWRVIFFREDQSHIKVSRGEQNIFIWCVFLAICGLVIDEHPSYAWVKYFYIDDPVSSLDDNNVIAIASDLAQLLKKGKNKIKAIISSHHGLFFNVMHNELKSHKLKTHFYQRDSGSDCYTLRATNETPFFHHVAMLVELQKAVASHKIYTYHFNILRSIMEKTAIFFGYPDFSDCIHGLEDEVLHARALNLLSHGKYSLYEPREMVGDTKKLFKTIFGAFTERYHFALPKPNQQESQA